MVVGMAGRNQTSMVVHGLLFGTALGMVFALVLAGGDALALGLVFGAGLGVVVGAVLEAQRGRRNQ